MTGRLCDVTDVTINFIANFLLKKNHMDINVNRKLNNVRVSYFTFILDIGTPWFALSNYGMSLNTEID